VKGWRTEQQNRAPWKVSNCPFPHYPSPIDPLRAVGNPFDLISHVPIGVFDRDLESGGVKCFPPPNERLNCQCKYWQAAHSYA